MYNTGFQELINILVWLFTTPYGILTVVLTALLSMVIWCMVYLGDIIRAFNLALKTDKEERP